jgi:hypothetical protein
MSKIPTVDKAHAVVRYSEQTGFEVMAISDSETILEEYVDSVKNVNLCNKYTIQKDIRIIITKK